MVGCQPGVEWIAREERDDKNLDVAGSGGCGRRNGDFCVWAGTAARTDAGADSTSRSANGCEGCESCSKRYSKNQGQRTQLGVGPGSLLASGPSAHWTDMVDLDGDGTEEDTQFLFDKQRGILYTYKLDSYQCANGSSQNRNVLMGIYSQGNTAGKPSGSGRFVVSVTAGQCGEKKAGLFGCRFDASGKPTTCGTAKVNEDSGELEVTVKK